MAITQEVFEAFLKCHTKAHLIGHGVAVDQSAIDPPLKELDDTYRHRGSNELRAVVADGQLYIGTPSVQAIRRRIYALITDCMRHRLRAGHSRRQFAAGRAHT
jgi:hypothetical protein